MIALPLLATIVSVAFAVAIVLDARRSPRPDKVSWAIAFAIFAAAAGIEVLGDLIGWSVTLARAYYLTGAVLVTLFLGLGQLYLLAGHRIARVAPGLTLAVVALAVSLVLNAPVDESRVAVDHWRAIDRGPGLITLVAISNAFGVVALLGGSLWSAWRFRRDRSYRDRVIGCLLIAAGTLLIAAKGYLARLGVPVDDAGFYVLLTLGAAVIFVGYLRTRRPGAHAATSAAAMPRTGDTSSDEPAPTVPVPLAGSVATAAAPTPSEALDVADAATGSSTAASESADPIAVTADPGIAFLEHRFLPLPTERMRELATTWSSPAVAVERLTPAQARQVWALRLRLSATGQAALDRHDLGAALQLAHLYETVLAAPAGSPAPAPPPGPGREGGPSHEPLTLVSGQR